MIRILEGIMLRNNAITKLPIMVTKITESPITRPCCNCTVIAKAEQMLVSVWDYLLSQKEQGINPKVDEAATAGATSSGTIASVVNPGMTNKNPAAGSPGKMAKKGPPQWMPKKQTPKDNALDKNVGLMTGTPIRR